MSPARLESAAPVEFFAALAKAGVTAAFVGRAPGIDVHADRAEALARLDGVHQEIRRGLDLASRTFVTAEQVHGREVAVLTAPDKMAGEPFVGADGVLTDRRDVCLGVYVADCCAVFLVDPVRRVIGLVHSGRKGTALGIAPTAIAIMRAQFGCRPADLIVQLSPCIRPPWYEVDFAAEIVRQCRAAGVDKVDDGGLCTAAHPELYYSYRREKGRTGRMLALLALA